MPARWIQTSYTWLHTYIHTYITLLCIALHYITLHYITLHCIALHYITLQCTTPHHTTLHPTPHHSTPHQPHTAPHHTTPHYTMLRCLDTYNAFHESTSHHIALRCVALHCIAYINKYIPALHGACLLACLFGCFCLSLPIVDFSGAGNRSGDDSRTSHMSNIHSTNLPSFATHHGTTPRPRDGSTHYNPTVDCTPCSETLKSTNCMELCQVSLGLHWDAVGL